MTNEDLAGFLVAVFDKGGPVAGVVIIIATVWIKFGMPRSAGMEAQLTEALKALDARVRANHEAAEDHREKITASMSELGQRVARIEGRLDVKATSRRQ